MQKSKPQKVGHPGNLSRSAIEVKDDPPAKKKVREKIEYMHANLVTKKLVDNQAEVESWRVLSLLLRFVWRLRLLSALLSGVFKVSELIVRTQNYHFAAFLL